MQPQNEIALCDSIEIVQEIHFFLLKFKKKIAFILKLLVWFITKSVWVINKENRDSIVN